MKLIYSFLALFISINIFGQIPKEGIYLSKLTGDFFTLKHDNDKILVRNFKNYTNEISYNKSNFDFYKIDEKNYAWKGDLAVILKVDNTTKSISFNNPFFLSEVFQLHYVNPIKAKPKNDLSAFFYNDLKDYDQMIFVIEDKSEIEKEEKVFYGIQDKKYNDIIIGVFTESGPGAIRYEFKEDFTGNVNGSPFIWSLICSSDGIIQDVVGENGQHFIIAMEYTGKTPVYVTPHKTRRQMEFKKMWYDTKTGYIGFLNLQKQ